MCNLIGGVITVVICFIIYFFALKNYSKQRFPYTLTLILIAGLILRLYVGTDFFLHAWDERYHALVAKNLISHPLIPTLYDNPVLPFDYTNWATNHVWLHKLPVPLWTMALSLKIFGINELALRLPSILLSTFAIYLTYKIALFIFDKRTALIAAFLHSIHGLTLELVGGRAATDHIDVFFQFFIELAIYFIILHLEKKTIIKLVMIGIATGLAILTKWLPALIVLPIFWLLSQRYDKPEILHQLKQIGFILLPIIMMVGSWQWYIYTYFPAEAHWESTYNLRHVFEVLQGHAKPWYYHFDMMRMTYGELIYIPVIWLVYVMIKKTGKPNGYLWLAIGCWLFVPYIFFTLVQTKMQAYTLFVSPALFITSAVFIRYLTFVKIRIKKSYSIILSIIIFLLLALPIRFSIERLKPFSKRERFPSWVADFRQFNHKIRNQGDVLLFNENRPIEAMFYCNNLTAYNYLPKEAVIAELIEKGYKIYVRQDDEIISFE